MTKAGCMFPRASSPYSLLVSLAVYCRSIGPLHRRSPIDRPLLGMGQKDSYIGYVPDLSQSPTVLVSLGSTATTHIRSGSLPLSRAAAPSPAPARMHAPQPGQAAMPTPPSAIRHIHLALDHRIRDLIAASRAKKENMVSEFIHGRHHVRDRGVSVFVHEGRPQPRQRRFFVNYLLCDYVLPDRTSEHPLRSALQTIDAAAKELPLASKISKILPDDFSHICQVIWGEWRTTSWI
ncbi:hypothetical protein B0H11DRAFT_2217536 [Mycena galericulata]|nr:hypothetical protein B0H11DRAFT_2217536 [Mycena galericulata]